MFSIRWLTFLLSFSLLSSAGQIPVVNNVHGGVATPSVVKNVASSNLEIRKLVYIFLQRYAETEPDLALLSINTFLRDLADPNPLIRAMALRVLSGINVPMVGNIVIMSVKKCATDPSPYVRKAAALAVIKCFRCALYFSSYCLQLTEFHFSFFVIQYGLWAASIAHTYHSNTFKGQVALIYWHSSDCLPGSLSNSS